MVQALAAIRRLLPAPIAGTPNAGSGLNQGFGVNMAANDLDKLAYLQLMRQPLDPKLCMLLVIDIQEKLLPPIFDKHRLLRNTQLLLQMSKILGLPVIASTQYAKGLGPIVPEIASLLPRVPALDKMEFGCFANDEFCSQITRLGGRNTFLICGMETHICVLQTVLAALDRGHMVHVAADAVSSRTHLNWKLGLDRMRDAGAVISSTEMIIYELLRQSGSPEFKEMLRFLK